MSSEPVNLEIIHHEHDNSGYWQQFTTEEKTAIKAIGVEMTATFDEQQHATIHVKNMSTQDITITKVQYWKNGYTLDANRKETILKPQDVFDCGPFDGRNYITVHFSIQFDNKVVRFIKSVVFNSNIQEGQPKLGGKMLKDMLDKASANELQVLSKQLGLGYSGGGKKPRKSDMVSDIMKFYNKAKRIVRS